MYVYMPVGVWRCVYVCVFVCLLVSVFVCVCALSDTPVNPRAIDTNILNVNLKKKFWFVFDNRKLNF